MALQHLMEQLRSVHNLAGTTILGLALQPRNYGAGRTHSGLETVGRLRVRLGAGLCLPMAPNQPRLLCQVEGHNMATE